MKNINFPMLLLALLVITMFSATGVALSYESLWGSIISLLLGFALMGYGLSLKRRKSDS